MLGPYEPYSLADAVEQGIMTGQDLSCRELLTCPSVLSFTDDARMIIAPLPGLGGHELGVAARNVVAACDACTAVMVAQVWASFAAKGQPLTADSIRREMLSLHAEDRAGNEVDRMWYIHPPTRADGKKTFEPFTGARTAAVLGRVGPLFLFRRFMKDGLSEAAAREKARKVAAAQGVSEAILGTPKRHNPN